MRYLIPRLLLVAIASLMLALPALSSASNSVSPGCKTKTCAKRVCKAKCQQRLAAKRLRTAPMAGAMVSWYGPGLYGNRTGCGQTLTPGSYGVAHKGLPCGTRVRICFRRCATIPVIDRGPYVGGRTFDLTVPARNAIGMSGGVQLVHYAVVR